MTLAMPDRFTRRLLKHLPWLVLAGGIATSLVLWQRDVSGTATRTSAAFNAEVERIHAAIEKQALMHEQTLRSAAAMVQVSGSVTEAAWGTFSRQLATTDGLSGITAIGHVVDRDRGFTLSSLSPLVSADSESLEVLRRLGVPNDAQKLLTVGPARIIEDTVIGAPDNATRVPGLLMLVPVHASSGSGTSAGGNGGGTNGPGTNGFVFSYFRPEALIGTALREIRRESRIRILREEAGRTARVLVDEQPATEGERRDSPDTLHAERTMRVGDGTWLLYSSASAGGFEAIEPRFSAGALSLVATLLAFAATLALGILGQREARRVIASASDAGRAVERYTSLINTAPDAIIGLDRAGNIATFNHAAEHMFRQNAADALGRSLALIVPGMTIERIAHALSDGLATYESGFRTARLSVTAERRGGMRFPVELDLGELADDHASNITCIVRDVTETRRAEEEMRLYKRAIASSSNGITIADVTLPDHPILYVNPAFERVTGYDLADVLGRNCRFLQGADTDPGAIAKIRSSIARGMECQVTLKNYMKDGTPFWNHLTLAPVRDRGGRVTHYIGIETDVTEIKQIEAALEERRQQLDAIFTLSPDGFVAFGQDRRITYANPAFLRIVNLDVAAVQGAPVERLDELLKAVCDPAQPFKPFADVLLDMGAGRDGARDVFVATSRFQDTVHLRNPSPKILQRSLRRATGGSTEFVLYLRDMTRETEVDRMKSEFLSSAAHELRTPMASIFGFTELLLRRNFDENTRRDLLQTIHKQAKHLTNLVNELLDLARIEARAGKDLTLEEQSLLPLIHETVESLLVQNDNRKVVVTLPEALPLVRIDIGKMRQALTNILSNAYKYSPNGGRIELTTEVRSAGDRDFLGVRVRDDGIGMTPEQLAHACERFYRADTSGNIPGTGLGLSLVKEIMELQGGSIELQSESGKGTTVTLWLPVLQRIAVRAA